MSNRDGIPDVDYSLTPTDPTPPPTSAGFVAALAALTIVCATIVAVVYLITG